MGSVELRYALPLSRVTVESQVSVTEDHVLGGGPKRRPQTTVALEVGAGPRNKTLTATRGVFFNTSIGLELTDEGRLTSTSLEAGGVLGKVVLGVVGAAVTVAGALAGPLPGAALAFADAAEIADDETPEQKVDKAFAAADPELAQLRNGYGQLVKQVYLEIASLAEQLAKEQEAGQRHRLLKRLGYLEELLSVLRAELDRLNDVFRAWRDSTIETRKEEIGLVLDLDAIRQAQVQIGGGGRIRFGSDASGAVRSAWYDAGVAVTVEPGPSWDEAAARPTKHHNAVVVRMPRLATVSVYGKGANGSAVLRERKPHLVMDSYCETAVVKLRKSVWAKRSVAVEFGEIGAIKSYKASADSSAAAAAGAMGELPATVSGSLEQAGKIRKELGAIGSSGREQELARVKQEVELEEQELKRAGLLATERDHAKLERLKQRAALLEQRKAMRDAAPPAPAAPDPTATEIAALKQQVELLQLQGKLAKLQAGD